MTKLIRNKTPNTLVCWSDILGKYKFEKVDERPSHIHPRVDATERVCVTRTHRTRLRYHLEKRNTYIFIENHGCFSVIGVSQ